MTTFVSIFLGTSAIRVPNLMNTVWRKTNEVTAQEIRSFITSTVKYSVSYLVHVSISILMHFFTCLSIKKLPKDMPSTVPSMVGTKMGKTGFPTFYELIITQGR